MTESKRLERDIERPTGPATPYVHAEPEEAILEALDTRSTGMPKASAATGPLRARTTIIEPQNSWNNRHDAARDLGPPTSARPDTVDHQRPLAARAEATLPEKTPPSDAVWPVVLEPADRDAVAVWRNEGDPN